jgi:hypothetical protein
MMDGVVELNMCWIEGTQWLLEQSKFKSEREWASMAQDVEHAIMLVASSCNRKDGGKWLIDFDETPKRSQLKELSDLLETALECRDGYEWGNVRLPLKKLGAYIDDRKKVKGVQTSDLIMKAPLPQSEPNYFPMCSLSEAITTLEAAGRNELHGLATRLRESTMKEPTDGLAALLKNSQKETEGMVGMFETYDSLCQLLRWINEGKVDLAKLLSYAKDQTLNKV